MRAEIIAVGTELLLGDIVNSNAQYIAKELAVLGIGVYRQTVVGDNEERLLYALEEAFKSSDIVITSGGLGPTKDDLTKEVCAKYLGKELCCHEASYNEIKEYFIKTGREFKGYNEKQAYFPADAVVLKNEHGTAPGCIMEDGGRTIINLPGPPREMIPMFKNSVEPYLRQFTQDGLFSKTLRILGIGESHMAEKLEDIIEAQSNPTIAPYAKEYDVTLRITARACSEAEAATLIEPVEVKIRERLGEDIYGEGEVSIEEVVGKMLVDKGLTISTAESCTGGLVAGRLINYPGISSVFMEGVVTYSNEAKMKRLGVKSETLELHGAVSEETAREMAEGIARAARTDIGISITGIAGPGGGTKEKPVGLVYAGLFIKDKAYVKKFNFHGSREAVRNRTVTNTLDWLRRELNKL
jgi:nicotinamide-nucleotide amidase